MTRLVSRIIRLSVFFPVYVMNLAVINDSSVGDESVERFHDDGRRRRRNGNFADVFNFKSAAAGVSLAAKTRFAAVALVIAASVIVEYGIR